MERLGLPEFWIGLLTLTVLEIVLGIDNIIFISILSGKVPQAQQVRARQIGLMGALVTRIMLLLSLSWIIGLTYPLFQIGEHAISGRDLTLIIGGLFLIGKTTSEIHGKLEGEEKQRKAAAWSGFTGVIIQIALLDIIFSLDSVITAVGMVNDLPVMVSAVIIAMLVMLWAVEPISQFVEKHPTVKMLALAFLLLIGVNLIAEGFHQEIPKGYIYFAMAFSVFVELLNLRSRSKTPPVELRNPYTTAQD